jgi:biopolymer transport protein ExbD
MAVTSLAALDATDTQVTVHDTDDPAEGGGSTLNDIVTEAGGINTVIGSQSDAAQTDETVNATQIAYIKGQLSVMKAVRDAVQGTVTTTDDGSFNINSLPDVTVGTISDALKAVDQSDTNRAIEVEDDGSGNYLLKVKVDEDTSGGGSGTTQYDEDTQHSSGDTGTSVVAVRNDTLASLVDTDGDYAPLQVDQDGALYVNLATTLDQTQDGVQAFGNDGNGPAQIPIRNTGVADDVAHPEQVVAGADLANNGDQVINVDVSRAKYITYTVNEASGGSVDVSIEWLDQNMNTFFTQSASDLSAQGVTQDYSRLNRRGPRVEITVSNNSSATNTNIFVDTLK